MREIAVIHGEEAKKLKHDENSLIIQRENRNGQDVAVVYIVVEDENTPTEAPKVSTEEATPQETEVKSS